MTLKLILWFTAAIAAVTGGGPRASEIQLPALLFAVAWLLGAAQPRGAWRRAAMIGLSIPLAQAVSAFTHSPLPYTSPGQLASFLALIPAFLGSYAGVASRRLWVQSPALDRPTQR